MSFSKDSEICTSCKFYDDCNNKRMAACAEIEHQDVIQSTVQPVTRVDGIYLTEQITKEIERQLNCEFMFGA